MKSLRFWGSHFRHWSQEDIEIHYPHHIWVKFNKDNRLILCLHSDPASIGYLTHRRRKPWVSQLDLVDNPEKFDDLTVAPKDIIEFEPVRIKTGKLIDRLDEIEVI